MFVRQNNGKIVKININHYNSEKQLYRKLWKTMFNIVLTDDNNQKNEIINYLKKKE